MLSQLSGVKARFPALLIHKYACDQSVIDLLRSRTLGNIPTALRNTLHELHSEEWLRGQLDFLTACHRHKKGCVLHLPHLLTLKILADGLTGRYREAQQPPSQVQGLLCSTFPSSL